MNESNLKNLKYCLAEINKWYQNNISEMQRIDEYDYPVYVEALQKVKELNNAIQIIPDDYVMQTKKEVSDKQSDSQNINAEPVIFYKS